MKNELWLIGKEPKSRRRYKIGLLHYTNNTYYFNYINPELNDAINAGFDYFPGFPDINKEYTNSKLFGNIATRLPNSSRPDYLEILNSYNLDKNATDFDILRATKGRLLTDNYEFVPVFDSSKIEFDIAGTRHCPDITKCLKIININDTLILELDLENKYDKNAIKVILNKNGKKYHLGYVPRYYTKELSQLLKKNIKYSAMIKGINFESDISDEDISAYVKLIFTD